MSQRDIKIPWQFSDEEIRFLIRQGVSIMEFCEECQTMYTSQKKGERQEHVCER